MEPVVVGHIEIDLLMEEDGRIGHWFKAEDGDGEKLPLMQTLGALRLAEDSAIRDSMGEANNKEDD